MTLHWVELDWETASACDLKKCGAWRYSEDPTTEIICASLSEMGEEPWTWVPGQEGNEARFRALVEDEMVTFVAFNTGFEKSIYRNIMVALYGWPDIPNSQIGRASCGERV